MIMEPAMQEHGGFFDGKSVTRKPNVSAFKAGNPSP
ncbi:hypothetical protein HNR44_002451 [Geomicrobium halophilum]|uniref:Uncharacterized protein n=1 Tax=Geomicrobium halophilum TaxID=549000 RepID=A0A841Q2D4_9BACL|nr:hypothetical protein [Geomicrobium halophilum]